MPRKGWISVSLPEALVKKVEEVIAGNWLGYTSVSSYVSDALRHLLVDAEKGLTAEEYKKLKELWADAKKR